MNRILLDDRIIEIFVLLEPLNNPHRLLNRPIKNDVIIEYVNYCPILLFNELTKLSLVSSA